MTRYTAMVFINVLMYNQQYFCNYNLFPFSTMLNARSCCSGFPLENIVHFSEKDLRLATDNYHPSKKIGRGGFGTVYQVFRLQILA
jgi:hypothetical protein